MEPPPAASVPSPELRRGPWTVEEDMKLVHYIGAHGEGRWNRVAERAGLKRTGKSCRLRWLNYLRPGIRRGNITPEEQLLILDLHSRWGNRWSKIAGFLPGRTDNEIKNYWRTRVQRHANHLNCEVDSHQFRETVRSIWMPRLMERIRSDQETASFCHQGDLPMATQLPQPSLPEVWFEEDCSAVPSDLFWSPDEPNSWLSPTCTTFVYE